MSRVGNWFVPLVQLVELGHQRIPVEAQHLRLDLSQHVL